MNPDVFEIEEGCRSAKTNDFRHQAGRSAAVRGRARLAVAAGLSAAGLTLSLLVLGLPAIAADGFRAGVARVDITPEKPVRMAGYESRTNLSEGVHDPLSARAAAFEQNGHRLVLVSIDNLGFYNNTAAPLRAAILDACHLQSSELMLCAIHTHSAPTLTLDPEKGHSNNVSYTEQLQDRLVTLVQTALEKVAPMDLSVASGSSPVGACRREVVPDKNGTKIVLGRNPAVLTDREVQVLKLSPPGQKDPAAVLFAYSTHSTSLGPRNYQVSGDIHGLAAQFVERYLGPAVVVPEFAGASGDVDPWVRVLPEFKTNRGWVPEPVLMGTFLGEEVARVAEGTLTSVTNRGISSMLKVVGLPGRSRTNAPAGEAAGTVPFTITVARLGEIAFVGLGGEVFNALGKAIKTGSPFSRTFIFTHCNGAAGYVPTKPSYAEGGYEVQSSPFEAGAGERLVEEALGMLKELHESI